jgi:hypothetical protein
MTTKRPLLYLLLALLLPLTLPAAQVIHPAPDVAVVNSRVHSLRAFRPQPVVIIMADSAKNKLYKKQIAVLHRGFQRFAARQTIFIMALQDGTDVQSNVPFVTAANPEAVAKAYGVKGFGVAIVGVDGNLDYVTGKTVTPERMVDVIQNGATVQEGSRAAAAR